MKVRVSGLVWAQKAELGGDHVASLKKALTIVPRQTPYDEERPTPIACWAETMDEFGMPRDYFFATAKQQHEVSWEMSDGHPVSYQSLLRQDGDYAEQGQVLDVLEGWLKGFDSQLALDGPMAAGRRLGAILQADPGFGKTNSALALAHRLGRTALIVVHKEFLLTQWIRRIHEFLPDAKVGIVREDKCDFEGKDIVVAMVQSLALEGQGTAQRYPSDFYRWPGVLFLDEVHRVGAPTWSPTPRMFPARWRVGLSATLRRRDGADKVFWWHIGQIRYRAKTKRPLLSVRMVKSDTPGPDVIRRDNISPSVVVNVLTKLTNRNQLIIREIIGALKSPSQRKIMVLSERLEHLRELDTILARAVKREGMEGITTGFYVGEWFTGEIPPALVKGSWEMGGDGMEKARKAIFTSLSRKKEDEKAVQLDESGRRMVTMPWRKRTEPKWRPLDELTEGELFDVARHYGIKQKSVEKRRSRTEAELAEAERARVIWATYQMTSEGVDISAVDTIGFASPVSDVEQSYGRGRRVCVPVAHGGARSPKDCERLCPWRASTCTGKPAGMAFDIVDTRVPLAVRRRRYRAEFYKSVGAKVREY